MCYFERGCLVVITLYPFTTHLPPNALPPANPYRYIATSLCELYSILRVSWQGGGHIEVELGKLSNTAVKKK